jgi:replicative DNA helicase
MTDRVMPHSLDAERSVLGAVMVDNALVPVVSGVVTAEMFYREGHQRVWRTILKLSEAGDPIDILSVKESLEASGDLERAGGAGYVAQLVDGVPVASNVEYYAKVVREKYLLRSTVLGASKILDRAYAAAESADEVIDEAERIVMGLGRETTDGDFVLVDDWTRELHSQIAYTIDHKRAITGVSSGLPMLDSYTRGFQGADLIFIGARPSVGKTSLMMQLASHASDHVMTGVVSLEMKRRDVGLRLVAMEARVDLFGLQTGYLSAADQLKVFQALERISAKRIAIDDAAGLTDAQLRAKVRRFAARHGLGIVFVDYLQLLRGSERAENKNLEVSKVSAGLKGLAKELDIPVVLLSQLNRENEKANRRPRVSDLRDSGSLEQDADVVMLLHRPRQHDDGERYQDGEEAELILAKQRNGPTGVVPLVWMGAQVRFAEQARPA